MKQGARNYKHHGSSKSGISNCFFLGSRVHAAIQDTIILSELCSTILSVVTRAKPKIANYHFTTLTPNLGIVSHKGESFAMADIPGL